MLDLGPIEGVITSHRSRMLGDKLAIGIKCDAGGESVEALIFITEKAMGMARRALKLCGFDCDKHDLVLLDLQPGLLAGNKVPLLIDEFNGKQQVKIDIDQRAEKSLLARATSALRNVKKKGKEGESEPTPAGKNEDYGDIPF